MTETERRLHTGAQIEAEDNERALHSNSKLGAGLGARVIQDLWREENVSKSIVDELSPGRTLAAPPKDMRASAIKLTETGFPGMNEAARSQLDKQSRLLNEVDVNAKAAASQHVETVHSVKSSARSVGTLATESNIAQMERSWARKAFVKDVGAVCAAVVGTDLIDRGIDNYFGFTPSSTRTKTIDLIATAGIMGATRFGALTKFALMIGTHGIARSIDVAERK